MLPEVQAAGTTLTGRKAEEQHMTNRVFNFNPGPAVLPLAVLENVRENLLDFSGTGMGIMEVSHRSKEFQKIIDETTADLKELLSIGDQYEVLYTTGGATNQFSMVPMNLLPPGQTANYIITGSWAQNAYKEAQKFGKTHAAGSSKDKNFSYIPKSCDITADCAYCHFTSNNTIFGTQFSSEPDAGEALLVCDASSDFLHKKIDVSKYGLIYAGAQKNLGPAGVTLVVIRRDLLERCPASLPLMMNYRTYSESQSLHNTPPVFAIYVVHEVLRWLKGLGGLAAIERQNRRKAEVLYKAIDGSSLYYGHAEADARSLMNVTFRLKNESLEGVFVKEAEAAGLVGLKGHRSVGGLRASIYNAFPPEGVDALVSFMQEFERTRG